MNKIVIYTTITYGILLIFLGSVNLILSKELSSFIIGVVSGLLLLIALVVGTVRDPMSAYLFIAAISMVVGMFSGITFARDNAFLPNGYILILSAVTFTAVGLSIMEDRKKS